MRSTVYDISNSTNRKRKCWTPSDVDDVWASLENTPRNYLGKKSPFWHKSNRQVDKLWLNIYSNCHVSSICWILCFCRLHHVQKWPKTTLIFWLLRRLLIPDYRRADVYRQHIPVFPDRSSESSIGPRWRLFLIRKTKALLNPHPIRPELLGSIHLDHYWVPIRLPRTTQRQ